MKTNPKIYTTAPKEKTQIRKLIDSGLFAFAMVFLVFAVVNKLEIDADPSYLKIWLGFCGLTFLYKKYLS